MARSRRKSPGVLYPTKFAADMLRDACHQVYGTIVDAAEKKGLKVPTLNRWANGGSLPDNDKDWDLAAEIIQEAGGTSEAFFHAELLDRADAWRREWNLSHDALVDLTAELRDRAAPLSATGSGPQ